MGSTLVVKTNFPPLRANYFRRKNELSLGSLLIGVFGSHHISTIALFREKKPCIINAGETDSRIASRISNEKIEIRGNYSRSMTNIIVVNMSEARVLVNIIYRAFVK